MKDLIKWLEGKKTYICAILIAATSILYAQGIIDETTKNILLGLFGSSGLAALRSGIKK